MLPHQLHHCSTTFLEHSSNSYSDLRLRKPYIASFDRRLNHCSDLLLLLYINGLTQERNVVLQGCILKIRFPQNSSICQKQHLLLLLKILYYAGALKLFRRNLSMKRWLFDAEQTTCEFAFAKFIRFSLNRIYLLNIPDEDSVCLSQRRRCVLRLVQQLHHSGDKQSTSLDFFIRSEEELALKKLALQVTVTW